MIQGTGRKTFPSFFFAFPLLLTASLHAQPAEFSQPPVFSEIQQRLGIPSRMAYVTDGFLNPAETLPEYILIQDLHRHPEVQRHIAAILLQAYRQWGLRKVLVEGAFSTVDLSAFNVLPSVSRPPVVNEMLSSGQLSGPELAAVLLMPTQVERRPEETPLELVGIENPLLYRENVAAYQNVQQRRPDVLREFQVIRRLQQAMQIPEDNILVRQLDRTRRLVGLKLTPSDYEQYLQAREATPSSKVLDPAVRSAEHFYRLVEMRSEMFLKQSQTITVTGPRVLVVGGFHTHGLAQALRRSGISYAVVSPRVTQSGYEHLYEERMLESVSALQIRQPL